MGVDDRQRLGSTNNNDVTDSSDVDSDSDAHAYLHGPEELCGGRLWDVNLDLEQLEYMSASSRSACELGFERVRYSVTLRRNSDNLICCFSCT